MFTQKSRVFSKIFTSSNWTALLVAGPTLIYAVDTRAELVLKPCSNTAAYGSFQFMCIMDNMIIMDKLMDAYTGFGKTVLFRLLTGFLGRAATGYRSSVAYRTLAKIGHGPYLKLSHGKHFSHVLIRTCYSVWPHHCCGPACTSPCT